MFPSKIVRRFLAALVLAAIVAPGTTARSQESREAIAQGEPVEGESKKENSEEDEGEADLRAEVSRQNKEIEILKEKVGDLEFQSEFEGGGEFEVPGSNTGEPLLDVYGFFDLTLFFLNSDEGSITDGMLPNKLSFAVNRINMYFLSRLTETFSALIELRLTFLPMGEEISYKSEFFGTEYERIDTTSTDPITQEEIPLGSLYIERVHFTWRPLDLFGIIAGRFLTPFGIWNTEHGSPVIIPIGLPYFMLRKAMPLAQTGLMVFGRFFPYKNIYVDYSLTVSNGRGTTEAVYDLDNNKALGGRLRFVYDDGRDIGFRLGGYLYWGENTEVTKSIASLDPFTLATDETIKYTELTGSVDLLVEIFGLRLQSELILGKIVHETHRMRTVPIVEMEDPGGAYQPDFIKWGGYGLVAYEFALQFNEKMMFLTPYVMVEFYTPEDTFDDYYQTIYRGGLNFKVSPFLTIKGEVNQSHFPRSEIMDKLTAYLMQVAVAY